MFWCESGILYFCSVFISVPLHSASGKSLLTFTHFHTLSHTHTHTDADAHTVTYTLTHIYIPVCVCECTPTTTHTSLLCVGDWRGTGGSAQLAGGIRTRNSLPLPLPPRTESGIPVDVALTWPGLGTGAGQVWAKSRTQGVAITSGAPLESLRGY